jgi:acetylornithine deacetylase
MEKISQKNASFDEAKPSAQLLSWLDRLVGFDTVSHQSNLGLIESIRDYLNSLGVTSRLTYDADKRKANLFATLGAGKKPGIVLSGHTDVVPVMGQAWDSDPFKVRELDGRFYGRGTADMKGFIAACLAQTPYFLANIKDAPIHFAFSYDEEVGCFGVKELLADLREQGIKPAACIVGEPTGMQPIVAHKGTHRFRCCVRGREAHSALPNLGVNAIEYAAQIVLFVKSLADEFARTETRDFGFPVPYTTLQTTLMNGGTGQNIVPKHCEFLVDVRTLPTMSFEAIYERVKVFSKTLDEQLKARAAEAGVDFEFVCSIPSFHVDEQDALVQMAMKLARSSKVERVSFGTEAGLFSASGIPTVVIGPGAIDDAHRPNESVSGEQLAQAESFLQRLVS